MRRFQTGAAAELIARMGLEPLAARTGKNRADKGSDPRRPFRRKENLSALDDDLVIPWSAGRPAWRSRGGCGLNVRVLSCDESGVKFRPRYGMRACD